MTKPKDIPLEHFIFAGIVLLVFSWFTISALLNGQIRMKGRGLAKVLTREGSPTAYWTSVGGFGVLTAFGWFAVGLNAYRKVKESKKDNPNKAGGAKG